MLFNMPIPVATIGLLIGSNLFMTYAWYGHLRHQAMPVLAAIVISWGVAFFEYCLQVPANRIGYGYFSAAELKTIQEVISLTIFGVFSTLYLGESLSWNHLVGFALIVGGAFFVFKGGKGGASDPAEAKHGALSRRCGRTGSPRRGQY